MQISVRKSEVDEHLTRDEKRARALSVPIAVSDIINLPMDEFNERLSKYDLSEAQLSLIRDIRRRGKNKVAAQNCRKRKLDQILSLADEVKGMRDRKMLLIRDRESMRLEIQRVKDKFSQLYRHIFQVGVLSIIFVLNVFVLLKQNSNLHIVLSWRLIRLSLLER